MLGGREFQRVGDECERAREARTVEIRGMERRFWSHDLQYIMVAVN